MGRVVRAIGALCTLCTLFAAAACTTGTPADAPASASAASAVRGKTIYDAKCTECHGVSGKGDGPAAPLLRPAPRDFTAGKFKVRTTETGSLPTDADLAASVTRGLPGTSMAAWEAVLSPVEIVDVVEYLKSFSPRFGNEQPQPVNAAEQVANVPAAAVRGAAVYEKLQCGKCHGSDGRATDAVARAFVDDWGRALPVANLTEPWTFRGGAAPKDIYLRFRTGMSGTPMPSFKDAASDGEMWDLAYFVASLARKPLWEMSAEEVSAHYAREAKEAGADPVRRGEYVVETRLCAVCHSPLDADGRILPGLKMAGGQTIRIGPYGDYPTSNLTSDKETGIGAYTDEELEAAITRGQMRDGSRMLPFPMDWPAYSALSQPDLDGVIAYLRSIPPVRNLVPPPSRPALPVYLWGKFRMLILGQDLPMIFLPGNAGSGGAPS
jgi:cytochrome c oxidase cbb3-type subunit 2